MGDMKTTAEIVFLSYEAGVTAMARLERHFEPDAQQHRLCAAWFERYRPLMREHYEGAGAGGVRVSNAQCCLCRASAFIMPHTALNPI